MARHDFDMQGRKEVTQAVTIAALTTLANGLINWSLDTVKARLLERKKRRDEAEKARLAAQTKAGTGKEGNNGTGA